MDDPVNTINPNQLHLETIDAVDLSLEVAGLGARSYAFLIDWHFRVIFVMAWLAICAIVFPLFLNTTLRDLLSSFNEITGVGGTTLVILPVIVIYFLYHPVLEILGRGRTPGKRMAGLRIVNEQGRPPTMGALLVRNIFRLVDGIPLFYMVGIITCLISERQRRLGDMAAGTLLVYDKSAAKISAFNQVARTGKFTLAQHELAGELVQRWAELDSPIRCRLARDFLFKIGQPAPELESDALLLMRLRAFLDNA